jgi:hypothetical protein
MSRKHYEPNVLNSFGFGSTKPSLISLLILILIILQFSKDKFNTKDNGIPFIVALFYLSCCGNLFKTGC